MSGFTVPTPVVPLHEKKAGELLVIDFSANPNRDFSKVKKHRSKNLLVFDPPPKGAA